MVGLVGDVREADTATIELEAQVAHCCQQLVPPILRLKENFRKEGTKILH